LAALQTRAQLLLRALRYFYSGLGLFASSALISIAGSIVVYSGWPSAFRIAAGIGVVCGASAIIALVCGCVLMIRETRLAVQELKV
jgi:MFS family permease